jgi:hypothetical protein
VDFIGAFGFNLYKAKSFQDGKTRAEKLLMKLIFRQFFFYVPILQNLFDLNAKSIGFGQAS